MTDKPRIDLLAMPLTGWRELALAISRHLDTMPPAEQAYWLTIQLEHIERAIGAVK